MYQSKYKVLCCILLAVGLLLAAGCSSEMPEEEMPVSGDPYERTSVVYYEQDAGYLVPVYVSEPWSDDIAEVLLEQMVASDALQVQLEESAFPPCCRQIPRYPSLWTRALPR